MNDTERDKDIRFIGLLDGASSALDAVARFSAKNFNASRKENYKKSIANALGEIFDIYQDIRFRHPEFEIWPSLDEKSESESGRQQQTQSP